MVELIPAAKHEELSDKLADYILTSKNDEKMSSQLAKAILFHWQQDTLRSGSGLASLLEAAFLLEPEKTLNVFTELQMEGIAEQIKSMKSF